MSNIKKTEQLKQLLTKSAQITKRDSSDATFVAWRHSVERVLVRIFGPSSLEVSQFAQLRFYYRPLISYLGEDHSPEHRKVFDRDFSVAISLLESCIQELEAERDTESTDAPASAGLSRVFVSHASKDVEIVKVLIDLLEVVGLQSEQIFCTSVEGYGIGFGENFLEVIREQLREDTLVLFVLSSHFYASPVCLCEMGAAWVQTKSHIPILVPPFDFDDVQGVIPLTQGFKINAPLKLNLFKEQIEATFNLKPALSMSSWERKRGKFIEQLNTHINTLENP